MMKYHLAGKLVAAIVLLFITAGQCMPMESPISLSLIRVTDHSAVIQWLGPALHQIQDCQLIYQVINATTRQETIPFQPLNNTIEVRELQPSTAYHLNMECSDTESVHYASSSFNFTTAGEGSTIVYTPPGTQTPAIVTTKQSSSTPATTSHNPSVLQEKISTSSSTLDLALGVLFGFLGAVVLGTASYFLLKRYRQHQRIRRFLQYRQQENDNLTDLDQEDDEGVVV